MSQAKADYYKFKADTDKYHEGFVDVIQNYVDELEKQNKVMLEALIKCDEKFITTGHVGYREYLAPIIEKAKDSLK